MAEEGIRAGGQAVCADLEDHDLIADFSARELDLIAEKIERRAKAADHTDAFQILGRHQWSGTSARESPCGR